MTSLLDDLARENEIRRRAGSALLDAIQQQELLPAGLDEARNAGGSELYYMLFGRDSPPTLAPSRFRLLFTRGTRAAPSEPPSIVPVPLTPSPKMLVEETPAPPPPEVVEPPSVTPLLLTLADMVEPPPPPPPPEPEAEPSVEPEPLLPAPTPEEPSSMNDMNISTSLMQTPSTVAPAFNTELRRFMQRINAPIHELMSKRSILPEELAAATGVGVDRIQMMLSLSPGGETITTEEIFALLSYLAKDLLDAGATLVLGINAPPRPITAPPMR